jgi:hypothetical protein
MPHSSSAVAYPIGLAPRRWGPLALLVGLALSLSVVRLGQAATTWTVCASGCAYTSIKAAIAAPTTLDGDTLAIAAGVYTEAGITVNKSLTLQGEEAATTIVQAAATRAAAADRVFTIPSGVTVTLQELTIRYGHAEVYGGGIYNTGTLTLTHCIVRGNNADSGGGLANGGTLTLTHSTVRGNNAYWGGGLANWSTLTLTHSTVRGNGATYGGGVSNIGTLTLSESTVRGNGATYGGGVYSYYGWLALTHSTVSGNTAGTGGGLYITSGYGTATLTHATVSGNSAGGNGGGLYDDEGPVTLALTHATVSGNSALGEGGGLYNYYGDITLTDSLVAANLTGGDCRNPQGSITSTGYNLDSDGSCGLTDLTDRPGTDPQLGPLQDNGGSTFTQALLPGSPALDLIPWGTHGCGTTVISDQRWQARAQPAGGACDSGAYELAVAGQALGAWVTGFTPDTVTCANATTGQAVTRSNPASPWDCEAMGLGVSAGDQVALRMRGPMTQGAPEVGAAVAGMTLTEGRCANLTTGQQVKVQPVGGTTAGRCTAWLGVHASETLQIDLQGSAE